MNFSLFNPAIRARWLAYKRTNGRGEDNVFNCNGTVESVIQTGFWDTQAHMYTYRENGGNGTSAAWAWKYQHGKQTTPTSAIVTRLPCWPHHIYPYVESHISIFLFLHHLHNIQLSCTYFQNSGQISPHLPPSLCKLIEQLLFISFHPSYLYEAEISGEHLPDKVDQWFHSVLVQVPPFAILHPPLRTEWNYRRD